MNYYEFEAGGESYKLRLDIERTIQLENLLGKNPIMIFSDTELPKIGDMCAVLYCSLQAYNHGCTMKKAYSIFEEWLDDGNTPSDFISVILEIYKASGLLGGGEKN